MDGMNGMHMIGVAMFGFLAVAAVALFSFISVAHWISTQHEDRQTKERFALLKLLLEHPGDEGVRVMAAWREQEALAYVRDRQQRLAGGVVTIAVGVALAIMFRVLAPESGVWAVGLVPAAVGCAILGLAYFVRSSGVESRP